MTVSRAQRIYPLALKADQLNAGIVAAYDWAAEDGSTAASNGKDHSSNARHWTVPVPEPLVVQTTGGKGRDTSQAKTVAVKGYEVAGAGALGLAVGTGDLSIWKRFRVPTHIPDSVNTRELWRLTDAGGQKLILSLLESNSVGGWRATVAIGATNALAWNSSGNPTLTSGSICDIHITRTAGVVKCFVNGVLITTIVGNTTDIGATVGGSKTINGNYGTGDTNTDTVYLDDIYWNRALTDGEVSAHAINPYSYYENQASANVITITAPASGATAGTALAVSGTYSGADTPTSIEASFNGGAWGLIDPAPSAGEYSGTLEGQAPGTGTLSVRWANKPEVIGTSDNITVSAAGIAFTAPSDQLSVRAYRMFQRDAQNQAGVRVSGTYTGSPDSIEYRWMGGAWTPLGGTMAAGSFDSTITLQGPGQGDFDIRFSNATGVTASVAKVGIGDIFIVAGQSNHVGMSPIFVTPAAPSEHPGWQSIVCGKDGVWRPHLETQASPFDDRTNALYTIQTNASAPYGSYFGALATRIMATGVPVAFVPCALGSSSLAAWVVNTSTDWLYGAALARASMVGDYKAVLWWQGEAETGGADTKEQLVAKYNERVNDWFARTGKKWFVWAIDGDEAGANFQNTHDALIEVGQTNPNCAGYADMLGSFDSGIHYGTSIEINEIADRAYAAMNAAYAYTAPTFATTVTFSVVDSGGAPVSGLSGLDFAFYDQSRIMDSLAPVKKGNTLAISGGTVTIDIAGLTTLLPGDVGRIEWGDAAGTMRGGGPVVVS